MDLCTTFVLYFFTKHAFGKKYLRSNVEKKNGAQFWHPFFRFRRAFRQSDSDLIEGPTRLLVLTFHDPSFDRDGGDAWTS